MTSATQTDLVCSMQSFNSTFFRVHEKMSYTQRLYSNIWKKIFIGIFIWTIEQRNRVGRFLGFIIWAILWLLGSVKLFVRFDTFHGSRHRRQLVYVWGFFLFNLSTRYNYMLSSIFNNLTPSAIFSCPLLISFLSLTDTISYYLFLPYILRFTSCFVHGLQININIRGCV